MKFIILLILQLCLLVSCSSGQQAKKDVQESAQTFNPNPDPQLQYNRAITMVEESPDLSDDQKVKLRDLIDDYAVKSKALRERQSQYRAVLIEEMLDRKDAFGEKSNVAKKNLEKINKDSTNNLEQFISEFKFITGERVRNDHVMIMQAVDIR
jgi:hypothetical protein